MNAQTNTDAMSEASRIQELQLKLAQLEEKNAELIAARPKPRALSCKVSTKGAVSVYGFGRFPVTLYKQQWIRLIGFIKEVEQFIKDNDSELKVK